MPRRSTAYRPTKRRPSRKRHGPAPEAADIILKNSGAVVRTGGDRAFYSPATDHIQLPPEHAFAARRNSPRPPCMNWRTGPATLPGSTATCSTALVPPPMPWKNFAPNSPPPSSPPNSASRPTFRSTPATSRNWIKPLKEDKREIFRAAADAQRIVDMELSFHPDYAAQIDVPAIPAPARPGYSLTGTGPTP